MGTLDELIHQPVRLRLMAALVALDDETEVDFSYLRDMLKVTDGNLGAHLRKLEDAGYVRITKTFVGRRPRTYIAATPVGREAFAAHVTALEEILRR
jgi:DNA-binding MarR family transcriptional regulator